MIRKIVGGLVAVISFGGLLLCAVGFFSPLIFYRSTDRDCLRFRFADGGAGIVYDGGTDAIALTSFSVDWIVIVGECRTNGGWRTCDAFLAGWILCPLLAVYPFVLLIRPILRRRRWIREGLCLKCGYSLTGNLSGVCPECGTPIFREADPSDTSRPTGSQT